MVIFLIGCAAAVQSPGFSQKDSYGGAPLPAATAAPAMPAAEEKSVSTGVQNSQVTVTDAVKRLVIKNATLSIVVVDPAATMDVVSKMAEAMGGFVVTSNLYTVTTENGVEVPRGTITVRVPAEKLTEAVETIKKQVKDRKKDVKSEVVSGQDVTKEYTDLQSRLTNLQNAAKQLQQIMDEATKTEDVLNVYNQLVSINEQIEMIKGQMKYYEESAALSAISLDIAAESSITPPLSIGGWEPGGVARDAIQALINFGKGLGNVLIYFSLFCLPIIIVLGLPAYFIVRGLLGWNRRRRAAKKQKAAQTNAVITPPASQE
jgi:hypothetical protein